MAVARKDDVVTNHILMSVAPNATRQAMRACSWTLADIRVSEQVTFDRGRLYWRLQLEVDGLTARRNLEQALVVPRRSPLSLELQTLRFGLEQP